MVISQENIDTLQKIADRERSPMYTVGTVTGDHRFTFESATTGKKPMDLELSDMFGSSPKVVMEDKTLNRKYEPVNYNTALLNEYLEQVLQLEAVASKDWLTNKVDRCVGGRVVERLERSRLSEAEEEPADDLDSTDEAATRRPGETVIRLPAYDVARFLPQILEGCLLWAEDSKNKFRAKVSLAARLGLLALMGLPSVSPEHGRC